MTAWERLSSREKFLLSLLFLVALPLALWALVIVPLQEGRERAIGALAGAQTDYVWVAGQAQQFAASEQTGTGPDVQAAGIAGIETTLIEIGLRDTVTSLETAQGGGIRLQLKQVRFDAFGRFLDAAAHRLGYEITDLRIVPGTDAGRVNASLALDPL